MMETNPTPHTNDESKKKNRKKKLIIAAIILCGALLLGVGGFLGQASANMDADQRAADKVAEEIADQQDADIYGYDLQLNGNFSDITAEIIDLGNLFESCDGSAEWFEVTGQELDYIEELADEACDINPPPSVSSLHNEYLKGIGEMREAIALFDSGIYASDISLISAAYDSMQSALATMKSVSDQVKEMTAAGSDL
jgi:hypothetical protein